MTFEQRQIASSQAAELLLHLPIFQASSHIGCYSTYQDEFETMPIIETIWQTHKKCYLPVVATNTQDKVLQFFEYEKNDKLLLNPFGIPEPDASKRTQFPSEKLELIIVPLIGFDLNFHRLGTGGGYYDKSFHFLLSQSKPHSPALIGLGYECQSVDSLPVDPWDVTLDGILTETFFKKG